MLHTINKSPFEKDSLKTCLRYAEKGSSVLFIEDAVYACTKGTNFEKQIIIGDVKINNNDYVLADIDGVVIIPQNNIDNILTKSEEKINSENLVRKAIKEGVDPQEAYKKYSAF